ncbi:MAG TPA: Ig-like domain-containing protein [Gaiellaceae bacterium]
MPQLLRSAVIVCALFLALPSLALAGVQPGQPFPTNLDTKIDLTQLTFLRVALPKPDCTTHPSDCADIDVLNTLDGFSVDARVSIPFSGPIDLTTVTPDTVFLVDPHGQRTPLDRLVWTSATNTLHGVPHTYLSQHTPYVLVVTDGVKAADGSALDASSFRRGLEIGRSHDFGSTLYRLALLGALSWAHLPQSRIVDASLFTTQSITSLLEKVRRQVDRSHPAPATFTIGSNGERAVFPFASVLAVNVHRQTGASTFSDTLLPAAVNAFPGAIGTVAYGSFSSPDYENASKVIPAVGSAFGTPTQQGTNTLYFNLWLPSGAEPSGGWPVAIVGHGFTDSKQGFPITTASTLAHAGIATIAVNVVGHGGGPLGTYTVLRSSGAPVTFSAGGRGIDQNGNGTIDSTEGVNAAPPFAAVGNRDGLRQTVIDLMQLVREVQVGVDVNGDGTPDLDPSRITYFGQSFGGIYGTTFLGVEPAVHAGVLNVPGGSITEIARLSPSFRPLVGFALATRVPSLYNALPVTLTNFNENLPLSGQPTVVDTVPGADAIQNVLDDDIWAQTPADPVAWAPYIRAQPLSGAGPKAVIVQFAKGDETVPNPTASALIRAGGLEDRATYFRNDLAVENVPGYGVTNPHTFLSNIFDPPPAAAAPLAFAAQQQIATFLSTGGAMTVDPDGVGPLFETPIAGPLPEGLNFLP